MGAAEAYRQFKEREREEKNKVSAKVSTPTATTATAGTTTPTTTGGVDSNTYKEIYRKATNNIPLTNPENTANSTLYNNIRNNLSNPSSNYSGNANDSLESRIANLYNQENNSQKLATQQAVQRLENQKRDINQAYDDNARQAYISYMQQKKAMPQQLAVRGINGGATETTNLGLQTAYQNNLNSINQNRTNALQNVDNSIQDVRLSGDINLANNAINNTNRLIDAYKYKKQYDLNKETQDMNKQAQDFNQQNILWNRDYQTSRDKVSDERYEREYTDKRNDIEWEQKRTDRQDQEAREQALRTDALNLANSGLLDTPFLDQNNIQGINRDNLNTLQNAAMRTAQNAGIKTTSSGSGSSANNKGLSFTQVNNAVKGILGRLETAETSEEIQNIRENAARYLITNLTDEDEVMNIARQQGLTIEQVARAMWQAGYDDSDIKAAAETYYGARKPDEYLNRIVDFAKR